MSTQRKLTPAIEDAICITFDGGETNVTRLSERFNLSPRTIARVLIKHSRYTPQKRMELEANIIYKLVKSYDLDADSLRQMLVLNLGATGQKNQRIKHEQVVLKFMAALPEATYSKMLKEIIHLREAKRFNSSVTNAMQQLQNRMDNGHT